MSDSKSPWETPAHLTREDFLNALKEMETFVDITVEDLMELNARAEKHARKRAVESILIREIMSRPVQTVQPGCSLADAAHLLVTKKISGLPVVDAQERLVGVITEADFLRALGVPAHHPSHNLWQTLEHMFARPPAMQEPEGCVADLMIKDVVSVSPDQTLHDVLQTMKKHHIKRVIVRDQDGKVAGIVTRSDLVKVFFSRIKRLERPPE